MRHLIAALALPAALFAAASAHAAPPAAAERTYLKPDAPIASTVSVLPGAQIVYISGTLPPVVDPAAPKGSTASFGGGTEFQTTAVLNRMQATLARLGLGLSDIVMMRVYLVGDPAKGGVMDFEGMNAAYKRLFGTADQPNRPSRATVQVMGLATPGALVEIEATAARPGIPR